MMKKVLCLGLTVILICGLCGCVKNDKYTLIINGEAVSAPLTLESLGKDYSLDYDVVLNYKGKPFAGIIFDENSTEQNQLKKPIKALVRSPITYSNKTTFSVGGIELGDTEKDVLRVYGEPTDKDEALHMWTYCKDGKQIDDFWLGFEFDDSGTVTWIFFRFD